MHGQRIAALRVNKINVSVLANIESKIRPVSVARGLKSMLNLAQIVETDVIFITQDTDGTQANYVAKRANTPIGACPFAA